MRSILMGWFGKNGSALGETNSVAPCWAFHHAKRDTVEELFYIFLLCSENLDNKRYIRYNHKHIMDMLQ